MERKDLVAVCGLYCGACEMYRADHDNNEVKLQNIAKRIAARMGGQLSADDLRCDGCLGKGCLTPWCGKCEIRSCERLQSGKTRCSDCEEFPCARISDFSNDGMLHHVEVLENLRHIRDMGVEDWVKAEEERWTCPECGALLSWYDTACPSCEAPRSKGLFALQSI